MKKWQTKGFEQFRAGTFGNGGQNIYVSKSGILQRIHQTDLNRNGYVDLIFCNSQNHEEMEPIDVYPDPLGEPSNCEKLFIGGATSGTVADLNDNGWEDLIIGCSWDGITHMSNSVAFFGSEEGINNKYLNYFPTMKANDVTAGDFNGNGRKDLVFFAENKLKIFYQGEGGFGEKKFVSVELENISRITAAKFSGQYTDLIIRKKTGAYSIIKGGMNGLDIENGETPILGADEDYFENSHSRVNYLQAVAEPAPRAQVIMLNGIQHLCAFRTNKCLLYPYENYELGAAIVLNCKNALAIAAGDIDNNGFTDLVVACRDKSSGNECSWVYRGGESGWTDDNKIPIKTVNACDVVLADFSGNGCLDIVIGQSHSYESYTNETLIFPIDNNELLISEHPVRLPSHNAYRVFIVHSGPRKRPYLVVCNHRSGRLIGDPPSNIYFGGPNGFHPENRLDLPTWGATDMVCCDLTDSGFPDIAFANAAELSPWLDPGSYIYHNYGGSFQNIPDCILPTVRAHGVVCGDLNHNGYLDLIFAGFDNPEIIIFYGSEDGFSIENSVKITMEHNGKLYKESRFLSLADLNNDGWLDLIVSIINEEESFVLWGGPDGFDFNNKQVFKVRHACNSKVADLNGNGYPDLIFGGHIPSVTGPHDSFVYIYWGSSEGYSENRRTLLPTNAVNSMAVADFNNDGFLDLFVGAYEDGRLRDIDSHIYWNQQGNGFLASERLPLRTHAVSGNLAADFNENGYMDLAIVNHKVYGKHIAYSSVWHNNQNGFDEKHTTDLPTIGTHGMGNVDPGNIMDRSPNEYYISAPYKIDAGYGISQVYWNGNIPEKCHVEAQIRFADSKYDLDESPWRGSSGIGSWFYSHQRVDKTLFCGTWIQYRLKLSAFNSLNTPRISEVGIKFEKIDSAI